jgi:hypothetical protein
MKRYITLTILGFLLSFAYYAFFYVLLGSYFPNILISIPFALAFKDKSQVAMFMAFVLGIFADLFTSSYIGGTSLFLVVFVQLYLILKNRIAYVNSITVSFIIITTFLYNVLIQYFIYSKFIVFREILVQSLMSIFLVFILLKLGNLLPRDFLANNRNNANK